MENSLKINNIEDLELIKYKNDILYMIYKFWGLLMQPPKPEYQDKWAQVVNAATEAEWEALKEEVSAEWFGDYDAETDEWIWYHFERGVHITWQQSLILLGVRKASNKIAKSNLSIVSGHGIGKSTTMSWILIWFLFCHYKSQTAATAPTAYQMHDVLWKEISNWLGKIKDEEIKQLFDWQKGYVRMKVDPDTWFARAKTSTKENTEALAGVHADDVLLLIDESSGVHEAVFNTAEGALTSGNVLMVMISNGTRTSGYFYDSHHKNKDDWQTFSFDGEESPMVDKKYVERQAKRHGKGSDEYTIRVSGGFPRSDAMDDSGYLQVTPENRVIIQAPPTDIKNIYWFGRKILGVDPSGEGKDEATITLRDRFKAICLCKIPIANSKMIAQRVLQYVKEYEIADGDVVIDAFGVGHDVALEVTLGSKAILGYEFTCYPLLVGKKPADEEKHNGHLFQRKDNEIYEHKNELKDLYLNMRALLHFRLSKWLIGGGIILDHNTQNSDFKEEIISLKYRRGMQTNTIQLMSKKEMKKLRIKSPNQADALSISFALDFDQDIQIKENREDDENVGETELDDRYSVV